MKKKRAKAKTKIESAFEDSKLSITLTDDEKHGSGTTIDIDNFPVDILRRARAEGIIEKLTKGLSKYGAIEGKELLEKRITALQSGIWVEKKPKKIVERKRLDADQINEALALTQKGYSKEEAFAEVGLKL